MKAVVFKGKVMGTGHRMKYPCIYVYREYGGEELSKHVCKEVQGIVFISENHE